MAPSLPRKPYIIERGMRLTFLLSSFLFLLITSPAEAQLLIPQTEPPASIQAVPTSPAPGEKVMLQAVTPLFNKDTTFYEWTINGQFRSDLSGRGKYSAEVIAGTLGSTLSVFVRATALEKQVSTMSLTLRVSTLSLVWSSNTSAPDWYRGKKLSSPGSSVTVVALPEISVGGGAIDPKNLIYQWSVGDNKNISSGVGKNSVTFEMSKTQGDTTWVRVVVEDIAKTVKKEGSLIVTNHAPAVSLYRYSPAGGTEYRSAKALLQIRKGETIDLIAEPFHFPGTKREVSYRWDLGGLAITGDVERPEFFTIRTENIPSASAVLSLIASSLRGALIPATKTLSIFIR